MKRCVFAKDDKGNYRFVDGVSAALKFKAVPAQLGALAPAQHERHGGKQRGQRGHEDGPKAQQRGLRDGLQRRLALAPPPDYPCRKFR